MSRTGKKPVAPVSGVTVTIADRQVTVKGPKGEQSLTLMDIVNAKQTDQGIVIEPANDTAQAKAAWGTTRALIANMVNGGRTPMLPAARLAELGFAAAIFPAVGFLATAQALTTAYADLRDTGTTSPETPMYSFAEFNELIGFKDVWEFEKRYAETE